MTALSFFVAGLPAPEGSMKAVTVPGKRFTQLVPDNGAALNRWRHKVTQVAELAANFHHWEKLDHVPVQIVYRFLLPMPSTRPAALRSAGIGFSHQKPDLDKLERAIGDALTAAQVWDDDCRVAISMTSKFEVQDHRLIGVEVVLAPIDVDAQRHVLSDLLTRRQAAPRSIR